MIYTQRMKDAIVFSIKTHEIHRKQKRKGKDIPYITHPLTVGIILAHAGASEDVIIAGLLHDTIEDSSPEKKVTKAMIREHFGEHVAELVDSVTEQDQSRSWGESKQEALAHIQVLSHDALMVKMGDTLSNVSELMDDHFRDGDATFDRFHASKVRARAAV